MCTGTACQNWGDPWKLGGPLETRVSRRACLRRHVVVGARLAGEAGAAAGREVPRQPHVRHPRSAARVWSQHSIAMSAAGAGRPCRLSTAGGQQCDGAVGLRRLRACCNRRVQTNPDPPTKP